MNFKNKNDEFGDIMRNKAKLVALGYIQIESVNFDENFVPVARLESFVCFLQLFCFSLFQMDVKYAYFNGILNEEA